MKHTKQLIASLIVIALLCNACSAGIGRGTPSNDLTGSNSSTAGSQVQSLSAGCGALPFSDVPHNAVYAPAVGGWRRNLSGLCL